MTYIKTFLPDIKDLKEMYEHNPERVVDMYDRYEVLQGSVESVSFVKKILNR
jgi:hypothetical protein